MQAIPSPIDCSSSCVPAGTSSTPGPQGPAGADGANGTNGTNAFTLSTAGTELMPASLGTVTVATSSSTDFLAVGQKVFVQFWGYLEVTAKPTSASVTLQNLETATDYTSNAAPGTVLPAGAIITPGGLQGPSGSAAAGVLLSANNLNDVASAATSRTNLGLGTAATRTAGVANTNLPPVDTTFTSGDALFATATGVQSQTAGTARTSLGLGTIATQDANAVAITGGSISAITDLAIADGGTGASTAAGARTNLGVLPGYGLLASLTAVDLNTAGDNTLTMAGGRYIIDKVVVENASINLTTATAGVFTAAGGGGTTLAADQALSALTASTKFLELTLQAVTDTDTRTEGTLYFRVGTPQGAAATASVHVFGYKLT